MSGLCAVSKRSNSYSPFTLPILWKRSLIEIQKRKQREWNSKLKNGATAVMAGNDRVVQIWYMGGPNLQYFYVKASSCNSGDRKSTSIGCQTDRSPWNFSTVMLCNYDELYAARTVPRRMGVELIRNPTSMWPWWSCHLELWPNCDLSVSLMRRNGICTEKRRKTVLSRPVGSGSGLRAAVVNS